MSSLWLKMRVLMGFCFMMQVQVLGKMTVFQCLTSGQVLAAVSGGSLRLDHYALNGGITSIRDQASGRASGNFLLEHCFNTRLFLMNERRKNESNQKSVVCSNYRSFLCLVYRYAGWS